MRKEEMQEVENHFNEAAKALRCAWRKLKKAPSFEKTAASLADTVLDVEESAAEFKQFIAMHEEN